MDYSTSPSSDDMSKRPGRSSRRRAVPKLRDSCTGCAASKVRCTKEKPSCSRCARRGIQCEYIVTRRTGRTSCRTSQPVNRAPPLLALRQPSYLNHDDGVFDEPFGSSMSMSHVQLAAMTPPSSGHASPSQQEQQVDAYPDMVWRGMMSPPMSAIGGEMPPAAAYMALAPEMEHVFDPTFSFAQPTTMPKTGDQPFGCFGSDQFSAFGPTDFFPAPPPTSDRNSISSLSTTSPAGATSYGDLERSYSCSSNGSHQSCLDTAITHLNQLLSSAARTCHRSSGPIPAESFSNIHATIAENKQIVEAISSMLDCACAQDDYILVIVALILLKVLSRYSTAAHVKPSADHGFAWEDPFSCAESACTPASYIEDAFGLPGAAITIPHHDAQPAQPQPNRPAAEKVLAELHGVRDVIHHVSLRMKDRATRASLAHPPAPYRANSADEAFLGGLMKLPASSLGQVENDLQVRLRAVSMEMIDILRRD